ncbi:MAG: PhoH family protein [Alphaproteobacteria bacterium]|nr:PhoH family protein [Alphaproteobacteria bacterium]
MKAPARRTSQRAKSADTVQLEFADNSLLPPLYGEHDSHLARIEQELGISLTPRGNRVAIAGPVEAVAAARAALMALYQRLEKGMSVDQGDVDAALRMASATEDDGDGKAGPAIAQWADGEATIHTRKRAISPRSPRQADYVRALEQNELVFGLGPAGTGKTYLAVAMAVAMLVKGEVDRIVLSRPAVEAGERLGFLPGDLREKVDPYLQPLYDALYDMLPAQQVRKRLDAGEIEIAPLAFMRGRTLSHAYVILDEAQNTSPMQMKMFLTRLGEDSRMVVTGDMSQIDLPPGVQCGLVDALTLLEGIEGVAFTHFTEADVVRHPLVRRIVGAYDAREARRPGHRGKAEQEPRS